MYEISRTNGRVIIRKGPSTVFNAPDDSYVVYEKAGVQTVARVKELPDPELLLALANAICLKE